MTFIVKQNVFLSFFLFFFFFFTIGAYLNNQEIQVATQIFLLV